MTVSKDPGTGMYVSDQVGGYFSTSADAHAAEGGSGDSSAQSGDFLGGGGTLDTNTSRAPDAPAAMADPRDAPNPSNPGGLSDNELARRQTALSAGATRTANINANTTGASGSYGTPNSVNAFTSGNVGGSSGAYNAGSDTSRKGFDWLHDVTRDPGLNAVQGLQNYTLGAAGFDNFQDATKGISQAGGGVVNTALGRGGFQGVVNNLDSAGKAAGEGDLGGVLGGVIRGRGAPSPGVGDASSAAPGAPATSAVTPEGSTADNLAAAREQTADAKSVSQATDAENQAEDKSLWGENLDKLRDLTGGDYQMSDEARGYQKEGLQQQRDLLKKTLGFDPNQYATQFADQGLARSVALARSGGTAAQQQAGVMAALDQAPSLYAEGARTAAGLENQRLSTAEQISSAFGNLGTATRSSDENRQQFESTLQLNIGKTFSDAVQGKMQLNEQESQRMSQVWMDFAQLQSVYAGQSLDEQLKTVDTMMAQKGLDQQWNMFKDTLKAQGSVSTKDLLSGFFQLGGGLLGAGGAIGAAYAAHH